MKVAVIGTGYVGLVAGTGLAEIGHEVTCVDNNEAKIAGLLEGVLPIYEPGLEELVPKNVAAERLSFTTDLATAVQPAEIVIIAVGTPPGEDGSADLQYVEAVASSVGDALNGFKVIVVKSTVPIGTCDRVRALIASRSKEHFVVVSNPEFLREGVAVPDFLNPDRIVVGSTSPEAVAPMEALYKPLTDGGAQLIHMDLRSSEMTKYASNCMLATRISFMNEIARLSERVGADVEQVRRGMGADERIGPKFLRAGVGYGGSCFPKDVKALMRSAREYTCDMAVLEAVEAVNAIQKRRLAEMVIEDLGDDLSGKTLALWGLAFKPDTDDMREAPSITIARVLQEAGAHVVGWDPAAAETAPEALGDSLTLAADKYAALEGADALLLVTEWADFRDPDWDRVRSLMKDARVYDGRNLWTPANVKEQGFRYRGIGRS